MSRLRSILSIALFWPSLIIAGGCWSNNSSGSGTISTPEEQTYAITVYDLDARKRAKFISDHVDSYMSHAHQLPGSTEFIQRILLGSVFDDLTDVLPILAGADPGAVFRQQQHIVQSTHPQLKSLPLDSSSDAIIEAGLRAASDALEDLSTRSFADQTDLATDINDLNSKIDELDTAPAESHRQIEADAVNAIGGIMQGMSATITQRLPAAASPSTRMSHNPPTMPS